MKTFERCVGRLIFGFVNTVYTLGFAIVAAAFVSSIVGCGSIKASGSTEHKVSGTATVRFEIDVSICESLPEADRAECVKALIELANNASKPKDTP